MIRGLTFDGMYSALIERDVAFEGVFIAGVKTTGIFCRPTCPARKPKRENTEFFNNQREALANGYRACKICKPMNYAKDRPNWLDALMKEVEAGKVRFKDWELSVRGYSPSKVRRYFNRMYGMTFQSYLRMIRINEAFIKMDERKKVTDAFLGQKYESFNKFSDNFKGMTGCSPARESQIITINRIPTPLGPMMIGVTLEGLCLLEFTDRRMIETQIDTLKKRLKSQMITGRHPMIDRVQGQLVEYFEGKRKKFDFPIVTPGTSFQNKVWQALCEVPYGRTRSYKQQADAVGDIKAVRAVARANGENRLAIVIPCHRIIGSDGSIVGYGGGIYRKQWLLKHEFENA